MLPSDQQPDPAHHVASIGPILVIEDDLQLRTVIATFLREEGFRVETAATGPEGLERIEQLRPPLVLLDMHLPGMNGWELARELSIRGISVPIMVMTAAQDAREWARTIGAVAYIPKPLSLPALIRRLDSLSA